MTAVKEMKQSMSLTKSLFYCGLPKSSWYYCKTPRNIPLNKTVSEAQNYYGITGGNLFSIYATDAIAALVFETLSDARIKEIISISDSAEDLKTLENIQITDYKFIDKKDRDKSYKKVIGQQIFKVYPQAVTLKTDTINDIMRVGIIQDGVINLDNHGLSAGDIIDVVFEDDSKGIFEILSATQDTLYIDSLYTGGIFVIGQQVDDFHYVDYDALSMLTISAVQEQQKIIKEQQNKIDEQQDTLEQLKSVIYPDHSELIVCQE